MQRSVTPFAVVGSLSIIAGGLISAASAPSPSYTASWAVAYLVLVAGVAQLVLGVAQAQLALKQPSVRVIAAEAIAFNLANAAVLIGTLIASTALVNAGAVLLIIALALFLWSVQGPGHHNKWVLYGFRFMIAIIAVSTPIGLVIAHLKAN